jgi:MoxR-like ATPase
MREAVKQVYVHPDIASYTVDIVEATRNRDDVALGVSPRGNLCFVKAAQALAAIRGRNFVSPQDVKDLAKPVLGHRLILTTGMRNRSTQIESIVRSILESIPAPTENWKTD